MNNRLNLAAHGINCADTRCVLPFCVNLKLTTWHNNAPQNRNHHTSEEEDCKEVFPTQSGVLDHATEQQLLQELDEFQRIVESQKCDDPEFQSSFIEYLGIIPPNGNPLLAHTGQDDFQLRASKGTASCNWNKAGNQLVPHVTNNYVPTLDMEVETFISLSTDAERLAPPGKSISESTEDLAHLSHLEQFMPMDSYLSAVSDKKEGMTTKRTRNDDHQDIGAKIPPPPTGAAKKTVGSRQDHKEQLGGKQPKNPNKLFGILADILRMFENPMSAELEAFYLHVLQGALKEIQSKVPFNIVPYDMSCARGFTQFHH